MSSSQARFGIKEIAKALGVSIGTVDRALHGRTGINQLTKQRVLQMAESMAYRPNLAARLLKSKKRLVFCLILPREIASFFNAVQEGFKQAALPFDASVRIDAQTYRRLGEGDTELFEKALADGVSGIVIAPGNPATMKPLIRRASQQGVPVVCVATDAPGTERLTVVSADPYTNGAIAAELLYRYRAVDGTIAVVTGFRDTVDHLEKVRGFKTVLQKLCSRSPRLEIVEAHDDEREAASLTKQLVKKCPDLSSLYVTTANSLPVIRTVKNIKRTEPVTIITTDLFTKLVPLLRSGEVAATMYQRPLSQGRIAFESLYGFLVEGKCPPSHIKLIPHIVMSSNLDLILEKLSIEFK